MTHVCLPFTTQPEETHWDSIYRYSATLKTEGGLYQNVILVPSYISLLSFSYLIKI